MWGAKTFWLSLLFFFVSSFIIFFFPPLTLFTLFFTLHFLLHPTIFSLKNYFPKLLNPPSLISLNIFFFQILVFLSTFAAHTFLVKPILKLLFSLHKNVILFQWTIFSYFSWKEISSIIWMEWWGWAPSRPQDPCSTFPHGFQVEFFFGFFVWKNFVPMHH